MAFIILAAPGEDATAGSPGQRDFVFGTTGGGEVITIKRGGDVMLDASFNSGNDSIVLPEAAGSFTAELSGSRLILASESGTKVSIPLGTVATMLMFDGGDNRELVVIDGVVHIGGQPLDDGDVMPSPEPGLAPIRLNALGDQGLKILGEGNFDEAGFSISGAGDVNNDGIADLLIGAPSQSSGLSFGAAYVVYGSENPVGPIELAEIAKGEGGFKIRGETDGDRAGWSVSAAGDFNNDGYADLLIGADGTNGYAGAAYIVFGGDEPFVSIDLADVAAGAGGVKFTGEANEDQAGGAVAGVGDVNGDGYADIVIGAAGEGSAEAGAAYLVFGGDLSGAIDLTDIAEGGRGLKIGGEDAGALVGYSVSGVGDVNGDGIDDLIISAPGDDQAGDRAGAAYLIFGSDEIRSDLENIANGGGGLKIVGEGAGSSAGESVSAAGDANGDGYADLLIGAPSDDAGGQDAGAAYIVFGEANLPATIDLNDVAAGQGGLKIIGEASNFYTGIEVAPAGDVNDDGYADILVGTFTKGTAYLIFGDVDLSDAIDLTDISAGYGGIKITGGGSSVGASLSGIGDFNDDGYADFIVGAPSGGAGAVYLIYGTDWS